MKDKIFLPAVIFYTIASLLNGSPALAQQLDDFKYTGNGDSVHYIVRGGIQFNGYTNYWHDTYNQWIRTGNLYKTAIDDAEKVIMQSKVDVAEELGLPGLIMQEGFIHGLLSEPCRVMDRPTKTKLESQLEQGNVLVYIDPTTPLGKELAGVLFTMMLQGK